MSATPNAIQRRPWALLQLACAERLRKPCPRHPGVGAGGPFRALCEAALCRQTTGKLLSSTAMPSPVAATAVPAVPAVADATANVAPVPARLHTMCPATVLSGLCGR